MVVISISYPPQESRYHNYSSATPSASASPSLTENSSDQFPSLLQVNSDGDTIATTKQGKYSFFQVNSDQRF